jgi:DNA ligase-1
MGRVAVEWKLDGVRIHLHKDHGTVRVFTRQLRDITTLVLDLVAWGERLPCEQLILDGEIVAFDVHGRPLAFQDLMSLLSKEAAAKPRLQPWFFDLMLDDHGSHLDDPYADRRARLERLLDPEHLVPHAMTQSAAEAQAVLDTALRAGHEGIVLKALDAPYVAGRRGSYWRKHKPAVTVDLVILAAEWGHGRRKGFLSNIHLGARVEDEPGRFAMLGKTFKGLTDAMLAEMTRDLLALETHREPGVVYVRPERVVEIAYDAVQRSRRYDSGLALRFARVKRFRPDKSADEATTLEEIRTASQ